MHCLTALTKIIWRVSLQSVTFSGRPKKIAGNENPKPNKPQKLGLQPKYKNDLACKKKHLATILKSKAG